jgi:hypothetical protein
VASQVWKRGCRHGCFARNPAVAAEPGYELSQSTPLGFLIWERNENHHGHSLGESLRAGKGQADAGFGAKREQVRPVFHLCFRKAESRKQKVGIPDRVDGIGFILSILLILSKDLPQHVHHNHVPPWF